MPKKGSRHVAWTNSHKAKTRTQNEDETEESVAQEIAKAWKRWPRNPRELAKKLAPLFDDRGPPAQVRTKSDMAPEEIAELERKENRRRGGK